MINFSYQNATRIVFGKDTESQVGALTAQMGKKVLLHYGGGSIKKSGLYDRVIASLNEAGVAFVELGGVKPNPRMSLVNEAIELCRKEGVDCILAVGGGSVIDAAKAIAVGVPYEGSVWDVWTMKHKPTSALPVGSILTIPAAGSETSLAAVLYNDTEGVKLNVFSPHFSPKFAILNPELSYTLPADQTANGICDMLAHVHERYFSPTQNVDFSDRLCEASMRSIMNLGPTLMDYPTCYETRANIMWAGCVVHMGLFGQGRQEDWACHRLTHQLSAIYDMAHGAALSIMIPAWMKFVYKDHMNLFLQFAQRVMDVDLQMSDPDAVVLEAIRRLEEFYKRIGLPTRFSDVGIDDTHFKFMAEFTGPIGNLHKISVEDSIEIYKLAL